MFALPSRHFLARQVQSNADSLRSKTSLRLSTIHDARVDHASSMPAAESLACLSSLHGNVRLAFDGDMGVEWEREQKVQHVG